LPPPAWRPRFDRVRPTRVPAISVFCVPPTHLHFDRCGGNRLFAGRPIEVQRRELEDARSEAAVVGGDVAVWFGELDEPHTEG